MVAKRGKRAERSRLRREVLGFLMAATGTFLLVALWPWDPAGGRSLEALNRVGFVGAYSAYYLYGWLGAGGIVPGALLLVWGVLVMVHRTSRRASFVTGAAVLATVVSLALLGLVAEWNGQPGVWETRAGAVGTGVAALLIRSVGVVGGVLVCLVILAGTAVATFRVSLATAVEGGIEIARAVGRRIRDGVAGLRERWAARGAEEPGAAWEPEPEPEPTTEPEAPPVDDPAPAPASPRVEAAEKRAGPEPTSFLPPLDLLEPPAGPVEGPGERELERLGEVLIEKLRSFHVEGEIVDIHSGPVLTQFEVKPAPGVKVNQIANLADDLALAMKAQRIRIVAPIPGRGAVGVEIPNPSPSVVTIREMLESRAWSSFAGKVPLALGREIAGTPIVTDLTRMPHLLIAGATGSGKSVCINAIVTSLLYRFGPDAVRLIMIDPKMLELITYNGIPHLLHPVVVEHKESAKALKWTVAEMDRRYRLLAANGVRSLQDFNARVKKGDDLEPVVEGEEVRSLPYIVVLIDELADLMLTVRNEIEEPLARLAQMARAVGIHLVLATQRPSVNVITGVIKANFPSRISFQVSSKIDSRTVLDMNGAEALLGQGDMLYLPADRAEPTRIQGAFVSTGETTRIVKWLKEAGEALDAEEIAPPVDIIAEASELEIAALDERDELFMAAAKVVVDADQGSTSLLQRRLRVGYSRAARILDQLEESGIVGPPDGTRPRDVLIGPGDLDDIEGLP